VIDVQFTRVYSHGLLFDPLAWVLDQEGATLASYRAAWCLAMEAFRGWLQEERDRRGSGKVSPADLGYSWGASDAALVEQLLGLQAAGVLLYKGEPADVSRVVRPKRAPLMAEQSE